MSNQSTLRSSTRSGARAAARVRSSVLSRGNKENDTPANNDIVTSGGLTIRPTRAGSVHQSKSQDTFEDSDNDKDADEDYAPAAAGRANDDDGDQEDDDDNHPDDNEDEVDDDEVHARSRRTTRPSEKRAQYLEEQDEAEARRQAKAHKAAQLAKKKAGEVNEEEIREPIADTVFTSRTVDSRPAQTKKLVQRDNRVPPPTRLPTDVARVASGNGSSGHTRADQSGYSTGGGGGGQSQHSHAAAVDYDNQRISGSGSGHGVSSASSAQASADTRVAFRGMDPPPPARDPVTNPDLRNAFGERFPNRVTVNLHQDHDNHVLGHPRPSSPQAGAKRTRSQSDSSDDLRTTQSPRTGTSSNRLRAKDLDDETREFANCAIDIFRCDLVAIDPFPDLAKGTEMVKDTWNATCEALGHKTLTPSLAKMVYNRAAQTRGELKTKTRPFTEAMFDSGNNKKTLAGNRTKAEFSKEGFRFAFKNPEEKKGLYKAPIIQKVINAMWFANARDEGPSHPEVFDPFPITGLALVLTVIENTIDEYMTGVRIDIPFTVTEYRPIYESHLKSLQLFAANGAKYQLMERILTRIHKTGRFHSGAQPLASAPKAIISQEVLDAAVEEYELAGGFDSDSDDDA